MMARKALVTGFPGFVARRLVKKMLSADRALSITALVESAQVPRAKQEIERLAGQTGDLTLAERIALTTGDVTSMDVGLSGAEFERLTGTVTEIYHLAAMHSVSADSRQAEAVNVVGTQNVLALARATRHLDRFVHFSSAYVAGNRIGVIMEDELAVGQSFRNAYESTKHRAELLVEQAKYNLPVIVIRPSGIVGDSVTGEVDRFDTVYNLGMLLVASPVAFPIPLASEGRAPLNLIPVDYAVDAVHAVVHREDSPGKTFHIVDPNPLSARRVYERVAERAGRKLPRYQMSPNLTKALLRIPGLERLAPVSHQAIDYLNHMAFYNSKNTTEALEGTGIRCPPFDEYVDNLIRYVREYFDKNPRRGALGTA